MEAGYAHDLSRTLRLSNQLLQHLVEQRGLDGIVTSHGSILALLFERGEVSMSDLAAYTQRDPSTVTALVKKLVAKGLVKTERSTVDRRSVMVALTEEGNAMRGDFDDISARLTAVWRAGIDPSDLETMQRVLGKVRANLEEALEAESPSHTAKGQTRERKPA